MKWRVWGLVLLLTAFVLISVLSAQELHLKTRTLARDQRRPIATGVHQIVEFDHQPSVEDLNALIAAGAHILAVVPDNAVMVSAPSGASFPGVAGISGLEAADKLSPALAGDPLLAIVEFHSDVSAQAQDAVAAAENLTLLRPPVLLVNHAIVTASMDQLAALAAHDEVAYIFPADPALLTGNDMMPCAGMITLSGPVAQYANIVHGWTPDAGGVTHLNYVFGTLISSKAQDSDVQAVIRQALNQWSVYANVVFQPGTDPTAPRTVVVKFASGAHGDSYPFDSTSGILAHTFYPVPINSESIAGDMHLNAAADWHLGDDVDVYTVALHEAGHALGLGHTDNPGDVMYPYYRRGVPLSPNDIGAVQALYGQPGTSAPVVSEAPIQTAPTQPPAPPPAALALTLNPVTPPGSAAQVSASGSVSGGTPPLTVQWQTDHGYSGKATVGNSGLWTAAGIALVSGSNTLTVTAFDAADHPVTENALIARMQPATTSASTPVVVSITTPSSATSTTGTASISLAGKASGGAGISQVVWQTSTGVSGTANGVGPWLAPSVPLLVGTNTIIVRAIDAKGANAWAAVVVVRN